MGRKVRESILIINDYDRRITHRKRRSVLVKKAMQLSLLTGCEISLSIFSDEDGSLMEYTTGNEPRKTKFDHDVHFYAKF